MYPVSRIVFRIARTGVGFLLLVSFQAYAADYFVAQDGADENDGRTWATAWATLRTAGSRAQAGDTVTVRAGSRPYVHLPIRRSGSPDQPIVFRGENPDEPPVISARIPPAAWSRDPRTGNWIAKAYTATAAVKADNRFLKRASNSSLDDGEWYWNSNVLNLTRDVDPKTAWVWREKGGGIQIKNASWITVENFLVQGGMNAGISLRNAEFNVIRGVTVRWHWRGVDATESDHNLIDAVTVTENREGIYIHTNSTGNVVRDCEAIENGTLPNWDSGDRHGIAIGAVGITARNMVEGCRIARNGGPPEAVALIAFGAPGTIFRGNNVEDNYGSGLMVTIGSDYSRIEGNRIARNGIHAVQDGSVGIVALAIRGSSHVRVYDNEVLDNYVAWGSRWETEEPMKGAIDIRPAGMMTRMTDIKLRDNVVSGTLGGPDIFVSNDTRLSDVTDSGEPLSGSTSQ